MHAYSIENEKIQMGIEYYEDPDGDFAPHISFGDDSSFKLSKVIGLRQSDIDKYRDHELTPFVDSVDQIILNASLRMIKDKKRLHEQFLLVACTDQDDNRVLVKWKIESASDEFLMFKSSEKKRVVCEYRSKTFRFSGFKTDRSHKPIYFIEVLFVMLPGEKSECLLAKSNSYSSHSNDFKRMILSYPREEDGLKMEVITFPEVPEINEERFFHLGKEFGV